MEKRDSNHIGDSRTVNLSGDTLIVFAPKENDTTRQEGSVGRMIKGLMESAGSMMSSIGRWLETERSFEITGVSILFSLFVFGVFMGFMVGNKYGSQRRDYFVFENKNLEMTGIALVPGTEDIFIPVYKEVKK